MQTAKYLITLTARKGISADLIEERVLVDLIPDFIEMTHQFGVFIESFKEINVNTLIEHTGCNYYVEVSEIWEGKINRIAFATV
jgi:hypothetical protein